MLQDKSTHRTELGDLGEFKLIEHLAQSVKLTQSSTIKGIGDDSAVIKNELETTLVSTDMLLEGIHFDLTYMPLKHLGYKAAIVNFSDLLAMNAKPRQITVGIAVSNRFSLEAIEEIYAGLNLACQHYGVDLVGGDTSGSQAGLCLAVTTVGQAEQADIVYRNGAKEHDLICVSGDLGSAYAGLLLLEREKVEYLANPNMQPDLQGNDYVLERQLKPEARFDIVDLLKDKNVKPTAMIDISDGLASELLHLCRESKVGCMLYETKIPVDPTACSTLETFNILPTIAALNGGEDYELLFTISQSDYDKIKDSQDITVIGHIVDENSGCMLVPENGAMIPISTM
ncbi:MAG: thiamine-phosphate kinase [Bacteroidales bacterium]|jgi:thiamine-monophosphate kinase|nr:thiamine-phosphate kinase [Bacteroidales bacterium]